MSYIANPVHFDGTNDYLTRGGGLTGAVDGKLWTGSCWLRLHAITASFKQIISGTDNHFSVRINESNKGILEAKDAGGTSRLFLRTNGTIGDTDWHHLMWSVNMADSAQRHFYLDGVESFTATTYANVDLDFTVAETAIGALVDGTQKHGLDLADVQSWFGAYIDLSQAANRQLFLSSGGAPVDPATAAAALGDPILLLSGDTDTWHTNDGTGGGYNENGALTDGAVALPEDDEGVTGTAAGALAAVTGAAVGAETFAGAGAGMLATATGAAAGEFTAAGITGTAVATLAATTGSAAGELLIAGTADAALAAATGAASGWVEVEGASTATLAATTAAATGQEIFTGTVAVATQAVTGAATAAFGPTGTVASALNAVVAAAIGQEIFTGTAAASLAAATASASEGAQDATGTAAPVLAVLLGQATGTLEFVGSAAAIAAAATAAVSGAVEVTGTATAALSISASATGQVDNPPSIPPAWRKVRAVRTRSAHVAARF